MIIIMGFNITKERMYHFPHNTLFTEELMFLLKSLDLNKKSYSFKEIVELLFKEEMNKNVFAKFHGNMPYKIISGEYPDVKAIKSKFISIKSSGKKPNGMPEELFDKIMSLSAEDSTKYFIKKRSADFTNVSNNNLLDVQYKPTKTWRQNWVEFVRDYIDFAAYCGLLHCYYKLPTDRASAEDGYVITPKLKEFLSGKVTFEEILMDFKYSNSSINAKRYTQFNIEVRPFYCILKLLSILKAEGLNKIDKKLLFGSISCLIDEREVDTAKDFIIKFLRNNKNINSVLSEDTIEEIGRFATGMHRFLTETKLIQEHRENNITYYSITEEGEDLLQKTLPNTLFFGHYYNDLYYSPTVALLLKNFADCVNEGDNKILIDNILNSLKNINKEKLMDLLGSMSNLKPSPIKKIDKDAVILNELSCQYTVSPYVDFASLEEAGFVHFQQVAERVSIKVNKNKVILPPKSTLQSLLSAALASDGDMYEQEIEKALKLLNIGNVRRFGQNSRFSRVSDVVWKLEYETSGEIKTMLVIFEAKAGRAIYSLKEDKESEDMINTLTTFYRDEFTNLQGIWVIILDSDKVPDSNGHGGFRGDERLSKSFMQKMSIIHRNLISSFGKPVLVTALAIKPFLEYYTYLYSVIKQNNLVNINAFVEEFYMKGTLFFDDYRYIKTINDEGYMKKNLFA